MPNFDRTGPRGEGPMTGRGMGRCNGGQAGLGLGRGQGRGFGFRRFFSQKEEVEDLKSYQKDLKSELEAVEKELKESK
jgi:hypothetical protein